jgi:hypothetical protein
MATASGAEAFVAEYAGQPLRWIVIDIWDGTADQCAVFELNAGLSDPMLMNGGRTTGTARLFDADLEHYFVIDGQGIIRYERNRADGATDGLPPWRPEVIGDVVDEALAALPVTARSFGAVKALWR